MTNTAAALFYNMHHLRSISDSHTHKLHKQKSHPHLTFTATGKTEELRDDLSSQSSSNDAKSDLSGKGSVKRTVKKVKKYLSRRFSGHRHEEGNYSISGGLVGAGFAYAALGRPVSAPNSPQARDGGATYQLPPLPLPAAQDHNTLLDDTPFPADSQPPNAVTGGDPRLQLQPTDKDTPDNSFKFSTDETSNPTSFDQSFDSDGARSSTQINNNNNGSPSLPEINIPVPDLPSTPPRLSNFYFEEEVSRKAQTDNQDNDQDPKEQDEASAELSDSITGSLTIIDSIESLRSMGDESPKTESDSIALPNNGSTPCLASAPGTSSTPTSPPDTADIAKDKETPSFSYGIETSTTDKPEIIKAEPQTAKPPNPVTPTPTTYDTYAMETSFDVFDIPYVKATVVTLAASGIGIMLANGVYRLLRSL